MTCSQCGQALPADSRFCPGCGAHVPPGGAPPAAIVRPLWITVLAVLQIVATVSYGGAGVFFLVAGDEPVVSIGLGLILTLLAAGHLTAAVGLLKLKPYGRILQIVFAIIGLLAFPLGTLLSVLILVYMFSRRTVLVFSGKTPDQLTAEESTLLARQTSSGLAIAVVAVVGLVGALFAALIAAIAIPNFLNAVDRGRQKRTMADIRTVAAAIEQYSLDADAYPVVADLEKLRGLLVPRYLRAMPDRDGWGHPFVVRSNAETYVLRSPGKDGVPDGAEPVGATSDFTQDIVFSDGSFVQWPEGRQQ